MTRKCVLLTLGVLLFAAVSATGQNYELLTWSTPAAAPANGEPVVGSASFTMRSRLGGPFAGYAESASFVLWGDSAYTAIEGSLFAVLNDDAQVVLRWSVQSTGGIDGFNLYRALSMDGPYERLNEDLIPFETPGSYTDRSVWPGTDFWYELHAVMADGTEEPLSGGPTAARTGGALVTRIRATSPNPFTAETIIHHDIASVVGEARLVVYDVSGRVVKTFDVTPSRPGRFQVTWNGTNDNGQRVASGVYFCSLEAGGKRDARPVVLLK